mgnify:CR=1 FL=1
MRLTLMISALVTLSVTGAFSQQKKNERPDGNTKREAAQPVAVDDVEFVYEFAQPNFVNRRISIRHGLSGKGRIEIETAESEEILNEELFIPSDFLKRIRDSLNSLAFLDSSTIYQYQKEYPHLGTTTFTYRVGSKSRTVKITYTENPSMKAVLGEYRKLGQQTVWVMQVRTARDMRPLDTPGLMDILEDYLKRNELSDPVGLVPFLEELMDDERLPLIARNKAGRIRDAISRAGRSN